MQQERPGLRFTPTAHPARLSGTSGLGGVGAANVPAAVRTVPSPQPKRPAAIQAVIFDLGDTIVHFSTFRMGRFLSAVIKPMHARLTELGFRPPPAPAYLRALRNCLLREFAWSRIRQKEVRMVECCSRMHVRLGMVLSAEQLTGLIQLCVEPVWRLATVDPSAAPLLAGLRDRGLKLGVVSNTVFPGLAIDLVLQREGLLDMLPPGENQDIVRQFLQSQTSGSATSVRYTWEWELFPWLRR